jgi:hypothetical protein
MTPIESQLLALRELNSEASMDSLADGSFLVTIPNVPLPAGWNHSVVTILFVAPPGYPGAQPDCFWVEPGGMRLADGKTPQGSSDSNPIPGVGPRGTWFSWHVQRWDPNYDSLTSYFRVVLQRLQALG